MDWTLTVAIVSVVVNILVAAFGWLFKQSLSLALNQINRIDERLTLLEKNFQDSQLSAGNKFVTREDWLRQATAIETKIEKLQEKVYE